MDSRFFGCLPAELVPARVKRNVRRQITRLAGAPGARKVRGVAGKLQRLRKDRAPCNKRIANLPLRENGNDYLQNRAYYSGDARLLMSCFRRLCAGGLELLICGGVLFTCLFVARYRRIRWLKCSFFGPEKFLDACREAIRELEQRDASISKALKQDTLVFWYDPKNLVRCRKYFSVNERYLERGWRGIAARLIYCYYTVTVQSEAGISRRDLVFANEDRVRRATKQWLVANSFPVELVNTFGATTGDSAIDQIGVGPEY